VPETSNAKSTPAKAAKPVKLANANLAEAIAGAVERERAGEAHGAVGAVLKHAMAALRADTIANVARGDRLALRLSEGVDLAVRALFSAAGGGNSDAGEGLAICAVGGYGRRELAPYSDIDLLFLHARGAETETRQMLDAMLYPLWDSGLKIGHGVHTPETAAAFAKEDIIARTAYLDVRYVCGSSRLHKDFSARYDKLRKRTKAEFVKAKLAEQAERQTKSGETRYLVEPDIKEGKGGLRDLQTIRWIYKYVYGGDIENNAAIAKVMDESEQRDLRKAERFFWSVRAHLHDLRGRADEIMSFDVQPQVAERLGYAGRKNMPAAERLMKHYFVTTVEVGRLTRILCARLEKEQTKHIPRMPILLPRLLQSDEASGKPNLKIRNGRLDFDDPEAARGDPTDFFRLFRAFSRKPEIDLHPDALAIVSEQCAGITSDVRRDPVIAKLFMGILTRSENPVRTLRVMTEVGLLGKYVPSFGSITGRILYGLYRQFTLDEHVLRSLNHLKKIADGELADEHPIVTKIVNEGAGEDAGRETFFLAVFLHETIWSLKDKSAAACERLATRVAKRLGLDNERATLVGWSAAHHLVMVRTAERRNLTEARAISNFAGRVETKERLDLMLVCSVCHLRIVGARSWDAFTRRRLSELYEASLAWLTGGEAALNERLKARADAARMETQSRLASWPAADRARFLSRLTDAMLRFIDPEIVVRFAYLVRTAEKDNAEAAVAVTPRDGGLEAIVYARDRAGLLCNLAAACAAEGVSVRSVQALTMGDAMAIDVFTIAIPAGEEEGGDYAWRIHESLLNAACEKRTQKPVLKRKFGDRRQIFSIEPRVTIDHEASDDSVVIETECLDRPGLLFDLTTAFFDLGVAINSAHIATYGERAVDAFYLQDAGGAAITDKKRLAQIEKRLLFALSAGSEK